MNSTAYRASIPTFLTAFYSLFTEPIACSPNFSPFRGGCYSVKTNYPRVWKDALKHCNIEGGTLARISREGLRFAFSNMLDQRTPKPNNLFFGLHIVDDCVWIDGTPLNGSLWMSGYPAGYHGVQYCAVMSAASSMIKNVYCWQWENMLCQKKHGK